MSTGSDLGYPGVRGPRPVRWRLINAYINRLLRVAHRDPLVAKAFMAVNAMVAPPQQLMRPRIVARVFLGGRRSADGEPSPQTNSPRSEGRHASAIER
jgi:hypothetical protein